MQFHKLGGQFATESHGQFLRNIQTMHQAYKIISDKKYGFRIFIAGPSKTADIEQSPILGAHGPRSLRVFLVD